jgi:hypothetical protein
MSWKPKDEFIDLAQARHVVIFHNPDTGAEHHLIHHFALNACATCGHVKEQAETIDFQQVKVDTLAALNDHHKKLMQYREKHPHVELRSQPK